MGQNSSRKPSILFVVHVWCDCNKYKRKITTNTGTNLGCFCISSRLRLVLTKLMLKGISWEQAWDTVNQLPFIGYLQICLQVMQQEQREDEELLSIKPGHSLMREFVHGCLIVQSHGQIFRSTHYAHSKTERHASSGLTPDTHNTHNQSPESKNL